MSVERDLSTMAAGWDTYVQARMRTTVSREQWIETRRAFYAGAAYLFAGLVDNAELSEPQAMLRLDVYQAELEQFTADLREGRA